jgi:predicted nucleic acid-binding protein
LLLVEVAAVIARAFDDPARGIAYAQAIRYLPKAIWVSLDDLLTTEALRLGAERRLRGADAIYAAVTLRNQTTLITLDKQQLLRLSPVLPVQKPAEALASLV